MKEKAAVLRTLYFDAGFVARAISEAEVAPAEDRRPTYGQMYEGGAYNDCFELDQIKAAKIKAALLPELHLVKDQGVYLMANTWFEGITIVYAEGCNPHVDAGFYDQSKEIMGGDDSVSALSLDLFKKVLSEGTERIAIQVTEKHFRIFGVGQRLARPKAGKV